MNQKIRVSAKQLSTKMGISYLLASNFLKLLEELNVADHVDSVAPEGRGRKTKIFEIPVDISLKVQ